MKKIAADWLNTYKYHLVIWAIFIAYEVIVIGFAYKNFSNPLVYIGHYSLNIATFYVNAYWNLPWAMKKRKNTFWRLPLGIVAIVAGFTLLCYVVDVGLVKLGMIAGRTEMKLTSKFILQCLWRGIYFLGFSFGYYFISRYISERNIAAQKEKAALIKHHEFEAALTKAQNAFLKAQINPHFLFNSLDFVYHSIDNDSEKAAEAILLLSRMMRYAVKSDEMHDFIYLEEEIEQVENLLYLHQLRKCDEFPVQLICSAEVRKIKFIPLVLLTLVENVLKHGDLNEVTGEAAVMVYVDKEVLHIETDNLAGIHSNRNSTHIGLNNIRKRLELAYENLYFEHELQADRRFTVSLAVPLASLSVHDRPLAFEPDNDKGWFHANAGLTQIAG